VPGEQAYSADEAVRWLRFLAAGPHEEIAWWRLNEQVPRWVGAVAGALCATALICIFGTVVQVGHALVIVLPIAAFVAAVQWAPTGPANTLVRGGTWLLSGLLGGVASGLLMYGVSPTGTQAELLIVSTVMGAGCGITSLLLSHGEVTPRRVSVRQLLTRRFLSHVGGAVSQGSSLGGLSGLAVGAGLFAIFEDVDYFGLLGITWLGVVTGVLLGVVTGVSSGLARPSDNSLIAGPTATVRADRLAALIWTTLMVLAFLGVFGAFDVLGIADAWTGGILFGAAFGATAMMATAWAQFSASRCWLALGGQVPWRVLGFLMVCHRKGLLRQSGSVYEFRHALLREYLAGDV
jgi:hypothetical protein